MSIHERILAPSALRHGNCVSGIGFVVALHGVEDGEELSGDGDDGASLLEPDRAAIAV
jgi:hypothetical protein